LTRLLVIELLPNKPQNAVIRYFECTLFVVRVGDDIAYSFTAPAFEERDVDSDSDVGVLSWPDEATGAISTDARRAAFTASGRCSS